MDDRENAGAGPNAQDRHDRRVEPRIREERDVHKRPVRDQRDQQQLHWIAQAEPSRDTRAGEGEQQPVVDVRERKKRSARAMRKDVSRAVAVGPAQRFVIHVIEAGDLLRR